MHGDSLRDLFLMKLRPEFESLRASLLNRNPIPSLDICVGELLREEQRIATQALLTESKELSVPVNVAYAAQGQQRGKGSLQCYSCKEYGHIARNCRKKFCNYCKQNGHIIKECPTRPENKKAQAFQATSVPAASLTPQQMILNAFSALGLQGQGKIIPSTWFIDSGASNLVTGKVIAKGPKMG